MIIVQLTGGLGNQLFQYAMGRALAIENSVPLKLDRSFFEGYDWHAYSLAPFAVQENFASPEECRWFKQKQHSWLNRLLRKTIKKGHYIVYEKNLLFDATYKTVASPAYLVGYWQCQEYFLKHRAILQKEFQIKIQPSAANATFLSHIQSVNAVSLHIRRGNFVSVSEVNKIHGTCSPQYYRAAVDYLKERVGHPVFFVFSDDLDWARENLKGSESYVFVDVNDAAHDYEDLRLMSHCRHHIIANSTFSWWAAWLNPSASKIIVAPKQWFADEEKNRTAKDIIPGNWNSL